MVTRPVDLLSEEEQMMKESGELLYWIIQIRASILKRAWTFSGMWLSSLLYQSCQLLHRYHRLDLLRETYQYS